MNIDTNINVNLSPDEVKEIIAQYVKTKLPIYEAAASDVTLKVGQECVGYYKDEHYETRFYGATIKCKLKTGE